jgi:hypothetical protein
MCELRVGRLVRQLDLDVELDRLAGEALAEEGLKGRSDFVADHFRDRFADHLLWRETEPLRVVPVDELEAGLPVALRDGNRAVVRDEAQSALAVAQQVPCRLSPGHGPSKLLAVIGHRSGYRLGYRPVLPRNSITEAAESQNCSRQALSEYIWANELP